VNKFLGISISCLLIFGGCSRQNANQNVEPQAQSQAGLLTIPSNSPKRQQIRVETVRIVEIPQNEVVSPAKLELNPNRVSRVLLPVPGRIKTVLVKLGDAVKSGQPVLELEGPDVDAAISSQLQADSSITQYKSALAKAQADYERTAISLITTQLPKKKCSVRKVFSPNPRLHWTRQLQSRSNR
jgi:membrane fusion protein, heavy metal efflux system